MGKNNKKIFQKNFEIIKNIFEFSRLGADIFCIMGSNLLPPPGGVPRQAGVLPKQYMARICIRAWYEYYHIILSLSTLL